LALRAFEAVARRSSFRLAAAELFVTPTAVSHQVRNLESYLGVRLLHRSPRSVSVTDSGRELVEVTASGLAEISRVVARLRQGLVSPKLTLSATTSFLSQWLVPRIAEVRRLLPRLDLRLHAADAPVALEAGSVDAAVRYGRGSFPGLEATLLVEDAFAPVCSPRLGMARPRDLRKANLIHVDGMRAPRPPPTWARWCAETGVTGVDTDAGLRFTDSLHAVQAAMAGEGVVIASVVLVADAIAKGLLVRPFEQVLSGAAYYFVCPSTLSARADVVALREWLRKSLA
jgi:LysR family glycine cleavage system transcriptional activator